MALHRESILLSAIFAAVAVTTPDTCAVLIAV